MLEIKNDAPWPIALVPGTRICKIVFFRAQSKKGKIEKYKGAYKSQKLIYHHESQQIERVGHKIKLLEGLDEEMIVLDNNFIVKLENDFPVT